MSSPLQNIKKAPWWVPPAIIFLLLWCVNYGFVQIGWHPFLYCWGLALSVVFEGWYQALKMVALLWFAWLAYTKAVWQGIWAILAIAMLFGLPVFWETATALGTGVVCR